MKILSFTLIVILLNQIDLQKKLYDEGLQAIRHKDYERSKSYLIQAYQIRPHSKIAFWISYDFAQQDSIQQCLFYLSKVFEINPEKLDSADWTYVKDIKSWAKERDYELYEKFNLTLSYKPNSATYKTSTEGLPQHAPPLLKRVENVHDSIHAPEFKISKRYLNKSFNE